MGDPHSGDPREEPLQTDLPSHGSSRPTSHHLAGPTLSSHYTTQGAAVVAQDQRLAASASNLGQDTRSLSSSHNPQPQLPQLSQTEPNSTGSRRGVDTDGGNRTADLLSRLHPRPQPPSENVGRSPDVVDAFAAAQAHAFGGPEHFEQRLTNIAQGLQRHARGRTPTPSDVHLIALLLKHLQSESAPALVNQHILDAVLPLSEQQVMSLLLPVQRGEQEPAQVVDHMHHF